MVKGYVVGDEGHVDGERADIVKIGDAQYAVVNPDAIYRVISRWNDKEGIEKCQFYHVTNPRKITKIMQALEDSVKDDSHEPILRAPRIKLPVKGSM
jgi:hypothetical protein